VQRAYGASTRALSALILVLGLAMIVSTLGRGGGALALGVVLGAVFALIGAGRLWLARGDRFRGEVR
jgi:multisubunit Na+/H+ antiporter MnhB subunit